MASGELSLTSNSSQEFECFTVDRPTLRDPVIDSPKDFASGKQQYDQAIIELNSLRLQHSDSKRRMDHIMEQLEFYREQYLAAMNQVEQSAEEGTTLRAKYTDVSNENIRLQQRTHHLEKKLTRYMETMKHEKDNGGNNQCAFVEQCNEWKKKYDSSIIEMEKMRKEADMCKKLCDDLSRDRNSLALEKDGLKQQVANTLREKNMYHDDIKEMTKVMQSRADELRRVTAQRNAAEHELRTILAERKGVLEENQKLSDDLTAAREEIEKHYKEDKKFAYENESLKREIESVLRYKDDLMKECTILREKLEEVLKNRDSSWKNGKEHSLQDNKLGLSEQHALDVESANLEIEKLRKSLERAMTEIEKSTVETEVAKSRRDWAISEREKIVLERDSVKILCDELRKERDTAISNLLAAIRDSEKPKKQKDEACRELDHIREQIDSQLDTSRRNIRWSCNPYDLDTMQKNDNEIIELDMSAATGSDHNDLGIILEGGREDSQNRIDSGIVVVSVANHSVAYGKLRPNDCIIQVNNLDCASVSKRMVHETIRTSGARCTIVVKRPKINKSHMYAVQLNMAGGNRNHGLTLETGVFITKITPGSLAAREDDLLVGDRILSINSKTMEGVKTAKDAMAYLDDNRTDSLTIISLKQITQTPSEPSSSYTNRTKYNKMVNICTQTEMERNSASSGAAGGGQNAADFENQRNFTSSNSKSTSKISEILNKFKGKMHIPGHHSNQKGSTVSESDSLCQENYAIEVLDSVLNNENASGKSKDNLFKRSKRSKKESSSNKEANKNLGTWPRANVLLSSGTHENHSGTIVQPRKKERPPLSFFTGPISLGKEEKQMTSTKKDNYFQSGASSSGGGGGGTVNNTNVANTTNAHKSSSINTNRNSNPIPLYVHCPPPTSVLNRHSVYDIETEPVLLQNRNVSATAPISVSTLSRNQKMSSSSSGGGSGTPHTHYHVMNPNRLSLNIPTTANISHLYNSLSSSSRTKSPITDIMMDPKINTPGSSNGGGGGGTNAQQQQQNSLDHIPFKNSIDSFLNPKSTMSSMDFKRNSMQSPQQLKDMFSLKSQNSIDSFLLAPMKSPPSIDLPMKPQIVPPPRESFEMYNMRDSHSHRMYRNVSKYPSDSDSLGMENSMPTSHNTNYTSTLPSYATQSRMQQSVPTSRAAAQRLYFGGGSGSGAASGGPSYLHTHNVIRQSSPLTLPLTQTIDSAVSGGGGVGSSTSGVNSTDKLEFEYTMIHHTHVASMDVELYGGGRTIKPVPVRDRDTIYGSNYYGHHAYEGGTFPRKKENQRFRIPSNPSVTSKGSGVKNSTGSIEHGSERGSPMPPAFQVEVLSHGANKRNSMPDYCYSQKPSPGDLRRVTIDKSVELGITITCNTGGGIFVSTVAENSIASQVSCFFNI